MDEIWFNMYKFDHSNAIDNKNEFNNMNEIMFMDVHDQHPCNWVWSTLSIIFILATSSIISILCI